MSLALRRLLGMALPFVVLLQTATTNAEPRKRRDVIDASETHGVPPGFHEEERPRYGMVIGGAVTTALGGALFLTGYQQRVTNSGGELLMLNGGLALAVGVPMLAYGLLSPRKVYVRDEPSSVALSVAFSERDVGARLRVAF